MSDLDSAMERELECWRITDAPPDWPDVVARAATKRRPSGRKSRRRYLVLAAVVAVAASAPAFALVSERLFGGGTVRGTFSSTRVSLSPRRTAVVGLHSYGSPLARTPTGFRYRVERPDNTRRFVWNLQLEGLEQASEAAIAIDDGTLVELCSPCRAGRHGSFVLQTATALELLDGHATLRVASGRNRVAPAAGGRLGRSAGERRQAVRSEPTSLS